jgi:hypothetical protein
MSRNTSKIIRYNKGYAVLIARVLDIAISTFVWRDYDITISAQVGLLMLRGQCPGSAEDGEYPCFEPSHNTAPTWAKVLNAFLNWLEPGHCQLAIECDIERAEQALRILRRQEKS